MKKLLKKNWPLLLILLAAFLVRIIGAKPGLQIGIYPDEDMSYGSASNMIIFGDLNPRRYDYPSGTALIHFIIFKTLFFPAALFKLFFPHPRVFFTALKLGSKFLQEFQQPIFGWRAIEALYWSRYITAFLGAGTVYLTYLLAKKLFGKPAGLLAAFLLAFNYRHVLSSHLALSDIPNSLFGLLAMYAVVLLLEKNSRKRYLLSGVSIALLFSIKYQTFVVFPFLFAHLVWAVRKKSIKELFNPNFILACVLVPIIFVALNPYLMTHLKEAIPMLKYVAGRYGMGVKRLDFYPLFYLYRWGFSELPSLAVTLGLILALICKPLKALILLAFVAPFFFVFIYYSNGGALVRNFTTVIPFLTIFAGFALSSFLSVFEVFWRWLKIPGNLALVIFAFFMLWFNLVPIKNSLVLARYYNKPWNSLVFGEWLIKNLPKNVQFRAYPLYLPQRAQLAKEVRIVDWDRAKEDSLAEFREASDDFVCMNATFNFAFMFWWFNLPPKQMFQYQSLPYGPLTNSFRGLVIKELLPYTVAELYKPWQAQREINYLLFKIPQAPLRLGSRVADFTFDKADEIWSVKGGFGREAPSFRWHLEEGGRKGGGLEIKGGGPDFLTTRFSSPPISVEPGKYYQVRAKIRNSIELPLEKRNAFLRLDFYRNLDEVDSEETGFKVALSSRTWGGAEWIEKEVGTKAPSEAQFLTISFQRTNLNQAFSSHLDDVVLYESDEVPEEKFKELPYIESTFPRSLWFPNSIL